VAINLKPFIGIFKVNIITNRMDQSDSGSIDSKYFLKHLFSDRRNFFAMKATS
jgi:hypothetical protein